MSRVSFLQLPVRALRVGLIQALAPMKIRCALLVTLLASPSAYACSCGTPESLEQQYAAAKNVAVVVIVSAHLGNYTPDTIYDEKGKVHQSQEAVLSTAEVMERLKGDLKSPSLVVSPPPGKPCYEAIEVGQTYVVFASEHWPILHSWCRRLPLLHDVPRELLTSWRGL